MSLLEENYRRILSHADEYKKLSQTIHEHPELSLEEFFACQTQVDFLKNFGLSPVSPYMDYPTGYRVEAGEGHPAIVFCSEYDALKGIGHGCGHNLICTGGIAAFLAVKEFLEENKLPGKVVLLGTPGEETKGAKVAMAANGALEGIDAALMLHPASETTNDPGSSAIRGYKVEFYGKSSHAAASPELGINALDAVTLLFAGVNAFRQQMPEFTRIHGVITKGGEAPNVIPSFTSCHFMIRSENEPWADRLVERFTDMVKGAALMTGCSYKILPPETPYMSRLPNATMNEAFLEYAEQLGMKPQKKSRAGRGGSDFGNFSQKVPGIHPYIQVSPTPVSGHSLELAAAAATDFALEQTLKGAAILATIGIRYLTEPAFRANVNEDFKNKRIL